MQKICIFTGARPNFVKVAPIIRSIEKTEGISYQLVYAGKSDDPTLEDSLFADLQMPRPDVFLGVDCENLNELTGRVMSEFEQYLEQHETDTVIVVDDLASTMAAAIVTKKRGLRLAHLVAGTRSFDIRMPKEINRLVIDGLSDLLFTAGTSSNSIATREGAEMHKIYMVGNILMDSLRYNHDRWQRPACLEGIADGEYLVFTINRKALLADKENLQRMLDAIMEEAGDIPVIAPLRPSVISQLPTPSLGRVGVGSSLPYLEFGYLTSHAKGIITDSGNVAEEATFHHVPCITLNSYTEHIETVKQGTNELVGEDAGKLRDAMRRLVAGAWKTGNLPDRWDGRSAERIVQILLGMK
ncbi:MAG: UDP-N-acetyl glucosamine 2-epimerase [Paludibacteraceae bacterium]|nr:UDP-N-acetyl glucosamine 2-epimerase [Paludibacteraceae bacterium]MBQ8714452.1 UDP-N-acetyl glucosamine 2-epimerase [Prevotella sp.]